MAWYRWQAGALILDIRVQPYARQNRIEGLFNDTLRLRLTAPPVDDKANDALCCWLADDFSARRPDVLVVRGAASRSKQVRVGGPRVAPTWFTALGGEWPDLR